METNHRTIVITRGAPASGKSTFARKLVSEGWNRVNKDDIRDMINGYRLNNADEDIIHEVQSDIIETLIANGRNIVVDNTHAKQKYVDNLIELVKKAEQLTGYSYEIVIKTFDTPLEVCLERNALRKRPVMEEVIKKMHKELFA